MSDPFKDTRDPLVKALDAAWLRNVTEQRDKLAAALMKIASKEAPRNYPFAEMQKIATAALTVCGCMTTEEK